MNATAVQHWLEANQRRLLAEIARVRKCLEQYSGAPAERSGNTSAAADAGVAPEPMAGDSAIGDLCENLGLSDFERDVLLLCAGMELDNRFPGLCALAQGDPRRTWPTLDLAWRVLPQPHWSALAPPGPLRHWRLIEVGSGETLANSPLRIDERALHYLTGITYLDERLRGVVEPVSAPSALPSSYRRHAERIVEIWSVPESERPIIHLTGDARGGKRLLAAAACEALNLRLHRLQAADIPAAPLERDALARLWEREAVFSQSALLVIVEDPMIPSAAREFLRLLQGLLFVTGPIEPLALRRAVARVEINRPSAAEQRALWEKALQPAAAELNGQLDELIAHYPLDVETIAAAGQSVRSMAPEARGEALGRFLWSTCRAHARQPLERLAERLRPVARWEDIVLPADQHQTLRDIAAHLRQRSTVYERWGFATRGARGLGISALFAGPSGSGKTMAAEVVARELQLDLYRIDLSRVVSKYIGETEKNLAAVFDAAEEAGAILLFDEADALFGKRSEVKDSHDRYANIEVSYLLQRMESYRGLAILTTNLRGALDPAFLRRLRFVVTFPFPDADQREQIWRRIFPDATPTEGLDFAKLARLHVTGGNIRNIALHAAFLAAEAGTSVTMHHLLRSARTECAKLEKPLTSGEIGGWV